MSGSGTGEERPMPRRGPGRPLLIGLTGPIGCGKSTVGTWLASRGAVVVDADAVARDVTAPGQPALEAVISRFGEAFRLADGSLDRRALGRVVFADPSALADLEGIVHPAVRTRIRATIARAGADGATLLVIEAIKLVAGGLAAECDEVWAVACGAAEQRVRLLERGMRPEEAEERVASQRELVERSLAAATRVIDTSGTPEEAERAVAAALREALRTHGAPAAER